ncbi:MAG: hypothetical protein JNM69_24000 [Archangium sp.]|nr:hypothetical protein [Archangium sp.]
MLSVLLTLTLGQTVWPPVNTDPFGFDAPLEPIRLEGPPALLRRGASLEAVWMDRRRGFDLNDAGLDAWAGTWVPLAGPITQTLLTREPRPCGQPRLLAESTSVLVAAWACQPTDGGAGFIETTSTSTGRFSRFPQLSSPPDNGTGPIQEFAAASSPSTTMMATRRPGQVSLLRTRPTLAPVLLSAPYRSISFAESDGGLTLLTVDASGTVSTYSVTTGAGPTLATNATFVVGVPNQGPATFVFQSGNSVRLRLPDAGAVVMGTNAFQIPPLVARSGTDTLAVFRGDGGIEVQVVTESGQVLGTLLGDGGLPLAIAGSSLPFTLAELTPGEVVLRDVSLSGTGPQFSQVVYHPFLAPAPQHSASAVWSSVEGGFLTLWDQRSGASWELQAGLIDVSGAQAHLNQGSSSTPFEPSLVSAPDGGTYATITAGGVRSLHVYRGGVGPLEGPALDETVVGQSSYFTWSRVAGLGRHSTWTMPRMLDPVPRGCVAWNSGTYWYAPASGSSINGISESGTSVSSVVTLPATSPPIERCLTIGDTGAMHVTLSGPTSVEVYELANGTRRASFPLSPAESPAAVDVGPGVVVVVAVVPDGGPAVWAGYAGTLSTLAPLTNDPSPARNVRAAKAPTGEVLASWESFDVDAGAWRIAARLIQPPYPGSPDAGAPDAGGLDAGSVDAGSVDAGSVDAGSVDAGSVDAGSVDAGSVDAGSVDAGSVDAGVLDAGAPDAGQPDGGVNDAGAADAGVSPDAGPETSAEYVAVCGCTSADSSSALLIGLLLLLRRLGGRT